jgi:hypothetical protein
MTSAVAHADPTAPAPMIATFISSSPSTVYNLQRCILDRSVWQHALQLISDWKHRYVEGSTAASKKIDVAASFPPTDLRATEAQGEPEIQTDRLMGNVRRNDSYGRQWRCHVGGAFAVNKL